MLGLKLVGSGLSNQQMQHVYMGYPRLVWPEKLSEHATFGCVNVLYVSGHTVDKIPFF